MIQLEHVHKSYGQTKVLKGIDLQIQDQDDVVILGPSGSGKSTLLKPWFDRNFCEHFLVESFFSYHFFDERLTNLCQ